LTWADILAQNKGKKIYLMASGLASFAFQGEALAKRIEDFEKNNVKVIFISNDPRREKWLKDLKTEDAKLFQHYHLAGKNAPLSAFLDGSREIKSQFSNILIDENGKVVSRTAADTRNFDLLLRQLRMLSKVLIP
jgi:alkyl hydroperoxide reductase subunit AhpC